jgi:hypothetical protein
LGPDAVNDATPGEEQVHRFPAARESPMTPLHVGQSISVDMSDNPQRATGCDAARHYAEQFRDENMMNRCFLT